MQIEQCLLVGNEGWNLPTCSDLLSFGTVAERCCLIAGIREMIDELGKVPDRISCAAVCGSCS
jgi:hypothetical protein